jgi:hypothetical protein
MPNVPIPDLDLIHSWRQVGISFREIGRRLAMKHQRPVAFNPNSIRRAYGRWLDAQGIKPDPKKTDLQLRWPSPSSSLPLRSVGTYQHGVAPQTRKVGHDGNPGALFHNGDTTGDTTGTNRLSPLEPRR